MERILERGGVKKLAVIITCNESEESWGRQDFLVATKIGETQSIYVENRAGMKLRITEATLS